MLAGLGSLLNGGALSGDYGKTAEMVYLSLAVVSYLGIIVGMHAVGLKPNKFEMIFVPTMIVGMVAVALSITNFVPPLEDEDADGSTDTGPASSDVLDLTDVGSSSFAGDTNVVTSFVTSEELSAFEQFLQDAGIILVAVLFVLFLLGLLYTIIKRQNFLPDIRLAKVQEYAKSEFQSNKTIIEYYISSSTKIEELKGTAPQWFTPTFFSEHVEQSPGKPLSSYFDLLTDLYELARFSELQMSDAEVDEARDLHDQIQLQIKEIILQLSAREATS
jgi:hypothetical protein